jgi:hydroxypyruvate isomerase
MLFAPNLSMLWADLPLADRFERAARAGFGAVELWWPGAEAAESLPGLTARWNLRLALLNFDAGDMSAGDRALPPTPGAASSCAPACRPHCRQLRPAGANG